LIAALLGANGFQSFHPVRAELVEAALSGIALWSVMTFQ
jgi:hypothetical protein